MNSPTDEIVSLFFSTFRAFKHKLDFNNPLFHMPLAQTETLRFIDENQQVLMKELADFLSITPPSATALVNNLVRLGFVQRHADKKDRRAVHLSLTKQGHKNLQQGIKKRCAAFKKLLDNLSQKQQLEFIDILKKLTSEN